MTAKPQNPYRRGKGNTFNNQPESPTKREAELNSTGLEAVKGE